MLAGADLRNVADLYQNDMSRCIGNVDSFGSASDRAIREHAEFGSSRAIPKYFTAVVARAPAEVDAELALAPSVQRVRPLVAARPLVFSKVRARRSPGTKLVYCVCIDAGAEYRKRKFQTRAGLSCMSPESPTRFFCYTQPHQEAVP
jgi:hypothetical protein